jgi:hypothetical protein
MCPADMRESYEKEDKEESAARSALDKLLELL